RQLRMVLDARRGLAAPAGVDAPAPRDPDGARHVGRVQSARDDDALGGARSQAPVESLAGASVEVGSGAVEKQGLRRSVLVGFERETLANARGLPHRDIRVIRRQLVAMKLGSIKCGGS